MRVWEAIEMLQGMDGNKEVTVTMGKQPKVLPIPKHKPEWVIDHQYWPNQFIPREYPGFPPNTITCKLQ